MRKTDEFMQDVLDEGEFDAPFFKVLARNDTGETGGHQGGLVIPIGLAPYFPHLAVGPGPTSDHEITAELYDADRFVTTVPARYQTQTWRGTRGPEHRLTQNLQPLLGSARGGDILMFERRVGTTDEYKLTLIRQGTREYRAMIARATKRSGLVTNESPATQSDFSVAASTIKSDLSNPFEPTEPERKKLTTIQRRVRMELFRRDVCLAYKNSCVLCSLRLQTPSGDFEIHGAHIIPIALNGSNDPRNGLALCRTHHWAFDSHLWTLSPDSRVLVPRMVRDITGNKSLLQFTGKAICKPSDPRISPAPIALERHRDLTREKWGI